MVVLGGWVFLMSEVLLQHTFLLSLLVNSGGRNQAALSAQDDLSTQGATSFSQLLGRTLLNLTKGLLLSRIKLILWWWIEPTDFRITQP